MDGRKTDTPSLDPSASVALAGFVAGLDLARNGDHAFVIKVAFKGNSKFHCSSPACGCL